MLYVEPAGGAPGAVQPRLQVPVLRPAGDGQPPGRRLGELGRPSCPPDQRPKTAAYPTLDDPFAQPTSEGIEEILKQGRDQDRLPRDLHDRQRRTSTRSPARSRRTNADLVVNGATFEDGVGMIRALLKSGYTPKMLYQTTAPSLGDQYAKAIGTENTEGIFYAVSHSEGGQDAGQRGVRRQVPGDVRRHRGAGGRGRRVRGGAR